MIKRQNIISFIKKSRRFGILLPLTSILLLFLSKYLPTKACRNISAWRHRKIEEDILKIVGNIELSKNMNKPINDNPSRAPIWFCWFQGEDNLPEIPKLCLTMLRKYSNNHPVIVITQDNYRDYVEIPSRIVNLFKCGNISYSHFSDILRINLITQKGGLWMDSTMLLTKNIDERIFETPFYTVKIKEFGNFVSRSRWSVFFIGGTAGNILTSCICEYYIRYWEKENCLIDYFFTDYAIDIAYKSNKEIKNIIDNIDYSNLNLHKLSPILNDKFDIKTYSLLTKGTSMFKLSWKLYNDKDLINNKENYFNYIKNNG